MRPWGAPADRIREPEKLSVPEITPHALAELFAHLSPERARAFAQQMWEALERARDEGDLRPVNDVVASWYRTLLFLENPGFEEAWEKAQGTDGPRLSIEDLRNRRRRGA